VDCTREATGLRSLVTVGQSLDTVTIRSAQASSCVGMKEENVTSGSSMGGRARGPPWAEREAHS
jgi:hypothetical protein